LKIYLPNSFFIMWLFISYMRHIYLCS